MLYFFREETLKESRKLKRFQPPISGSPEVEESTAIDFISSEFRILGKKINGFKFFLGKTFDEL